MLGDEGPVLELAGDDHLAALAERVGDGSGVVDRDGSHSVPVSYTGTVPDPFREGREVIVTGKLEDGTFVAEHDSLVTKCPSKFSEEAQQDPEHVVIDQ